METKNRVQCLKASLTSDAGQMVPKIIFLFPLNAKYIHIRMSIISLLIITRHNGGGLVLRQKQKQALMW